MCELYLALWEPEIAQGRGPVGNEQFKEPQPYPTHVLVFLECSALRIGEGFSVNAAWEVRAALQPVLETWTEGLETEAGFLLKLSRCCRNTLDCGRFSGHATRTCI